MPRNKAMDFEKAHGTVRSTRANDPIKYMQGDSYYDHSGDFVRLVNPGAKVAPKPKPVPQAAKKTAADLKREALSAAADKLGMDNTVPQALKDAAKENAEAKAAAYTW